MRHLHQVMARPHEPGQDAFKAIRSEDVEWRPFAAFPSEVRLAALVGEPSERGLYVVRVKVPHGVRLMPHRHPEDRTYTVMSGIFYIGLGDTFDASRLQRIRPAPSSYCPAGRLTFTGPGPASTSRR